ncbi:MAG: acyl-[ACP]--phospholipid O-acyltransferase [Magnetococcus sp. WYHC-3]
MAAAARILLTSRRFFPLFATQFLGAFNDNLYKNALVILITFQGSSSLGLPPSILVTLAAGLFILPFFLFSSTAGQLADRQEKSALIRHVKQAEVVIMLLGALGFWWNDTAFLLGVLFLMGAQSAFFGPLKYGILPDHLAPEELVAGNGLIEAGTFLAILGGTLAGGLLILGPHGVPLVSTLVVALALAGWGTSLAIPPAPAADPELRLDPNLLRQTWAVVRLTRGRQDVFLAVLGISWFWLVGALYLAEFPTFAKEVLGGDAHLVTLLLVVFTVGIGAGSLACSRLLGGRPDTRLVPWGALGMGLFALDLYLASRHLTALGPPPLTLPLLLAQAHTWHILGDLLAMATCGGLFIVPLYTLMQSRSPTALRSRVVAGNNILNALFMVISALLAAALLARGWSIPELFLLAGLANVGVAAVSCALLPDAALKALFATLFRLCYRVRVLGLEHLHDAGPRCVIVVNHVSFLDGALLATFLPGRPAFAVNTHMANLWWVKPFLSLVDAVSLDPSNPFALKQLTRLVRRGTPCVIFPEGRITVTGTLMKIYEGPGLIAAHAGARLLPVRIDGAQYTPFSRLRGKVRRRWFPAIRITILPPRDLRPLPAGMGNRQRREQVSLQLYDMLGDMMVASAPTHLTLFQALENAMRVHGGGHVIAEDTARIPLNYRRLITAARLLGRHLARDTQPGERVGLLLPTAVGTLVAFFALQSRGRVPVLLNISAGEQHLRSAIGTATLKRIITSRRFLAAAGLEAMVARWEGLVCVIHLEDVRAAISPLERLAALARTTLGGAQSPCAQPDDAAVVLFTSGSEGTPKGVVLTHRNLLANCQQLATRIAFNPTDILFNALPAFHAFGLTGGMLLPVLSGVRTFLYPSPLHYRTIPERVYETNATLLFGTDTFLAGYARRAHNYDFYSVRMVFAGAERLREPTRRLWMERFGLRILEGYGATETAPALAANDPMQFRAGTVGRFLPGITYRLEPVAGIPRGGRLLVRGPNVMAGYLRAEQPGVLMPPPGGEYDTGDIVEVDEQGFVTLVGRVKRFAKIAGEMISLGAVEEEAALAWPGYAHAVLARPDPRKGEQLEWVTTCPSASREGFQAHIRQRQLSDLMVPRRVRIVAQLPVLGSGKTDYMALQNPADTAPTEPG